MAIAGEPHDIQAFCHPHDSVSRAANAVFTPPVSDLSQLPEYRMILLKISKQTEESEKSPVADT